MNEKIDFSDPCFLVQKVFLYSLKCGILKLVQLTRLLKKVFKVIRQLLQSCNLFFRHCSLFQEVVCLLL